MSSPPAAPPPPPPPPKPKGLPPPPPPPAAPGSPSGTQAVAAPPSNIPPFNALPPPPPPPGRTPVKVATKPLPKPVEPVEAEPAEGDSSDPVQHHAPKPAAKPAPPPPPPPPKPKAIPKPPPQSPPTAPPVTQPPTEQPSQQQQPQEEPEVNRAEADQERAVETTKPVTTEEHQQEESKQEEPQQQQQQQQQQQGPQNRRGSQVGSDKSQTSSSHKSTQGSDTGKVKGEEDKQKAGDGHNSDSDSVKSADSMGSEAETADDESPQPTWQEIYALHKAQALGHLRNKHEAELRKQREEEALHLAYLAQRKVEREQDQETENSDESYFGVHKQNSKYSDDETLSPEDKRLRQWRRGQRFLAEKQQKQQALAEFHDSFERRHETFKPVLSPKAKTIRKTPKDPAFQYHYQMLIKKEKEDELQKIRDLKDDEEITELKTKPYINPNTDSILQAAHHKYKCKPYEGPVQGWDDRFAVYMSHKRMETWRPDENMFDAGASVADVRSELHQKQHKRSKEARRNWANGRQGPTDPVVKHPRVLNPNRGPHPRSSSLHSPRARQSSGGPNKHSSRNSSPQHSNYISPIKQRAPSQSPKKYMKNVMSDAEVDTITSSGSVASSKHKKSQPPHISSQPPREAKHVPSKLIVDEGSGDPTGPIKQSSEFNSTPYTRFSQIKSNNSQHPQQSSHHTRTHASTPKRDGGNAGASSSSSAGHGPTPPSRQHKTPQQTAGGSSGASPKLGNSGKPLPIDETLKWGKLTVRLVDGIGITARPAFVQLMLHDAVQTSDAIPKPEEGIGTYTGTPLGTPDPVWNEDFVFDVELQTVRVPKSEGGDDKAVLLPLYPELRVVMWDANYQRVVGDSVISLTDLVRDVPKDVLTVLRHKGESQGCVRLWLLTNDFGYHRPYLKNSPEENDILDQLPSKYSKLQPYPKSNNNRASPVRLPQSEISETSNELGKLWIAVLRATKCERLNSMDPEDRNSFVVLSIGGHVRPTQRSSQVEPAWYQSFELPVSLRQETTGIGASRGVCDVANQRLEVSLWNDLANVETPIGEAVVSLDALYRGVPQTMSFSLHDTDHNRQTALVELQMVATDFGLPSNTSQHQTSVPNLVKPQSKPARPNSRGSSSNGKASPTGATVGGRSSLSSSPSSSPPKRAVSPKKARFSDQKPPTSSSSTQTAPSSGSRSSSRQRQQGGSRSGSPVAAEPNTGTTRQHRSPILRPPPRTVSPNRSQQRQQPTFPVSKRTPIIAPGPLGMIQLCMDEEISIADSDSDAPSYMHIPNLSMISNSPQQHMYFYPQTGVPMTANTPPLSPFSLSPPPHHEGRDSPLYISPVGTPPPPPPLPPLPDDMDYEEFTQSTITQVVHTSMVAPSQKSSRSSRSSKHSREGTPTTESVAPADSSTSQQGVPGTRLHKLQNILSILDTMYGDDGAPVGPPSGRIGSPPRRAASPPLPPVHMLEDYVTHNNSNINIGVENAQQWSPPRSTTRASKNVNDTSTAGSTHSSTRTKKDNNSREVSPSRKRTPSPAAEAVGRRIQNIRKLCALNEELDWLQEQKKTVEELQTIAQKIDPDKMIAASELAFEEGGVPRSDIDNDDDNISEASSIQYDISPVGTPPPPPPLDTQYRLQLPPKCFNTAHQHDVQQQILQNSQGPTNSYEMTQPHHEHTQNVPPSPHQERQSSPYSPQDEMDYSEISQFPQHHDQYMYDMPNQHQQQHLQQHSQHPQQHPQQHMHPHQQVPDTNFLPDNQIFDNQYYETPVSPVSNPSVGRYFPATDNSTLLLNGGLSPPHNNIFGTPNANQSMMPPYEDATPYMVDMGGYPPIPMDSLNSGIPHNGAPPSLMMGTDTGHPSMPPQGQPRNAYPQQLPMQQYDTSNGQPIGYLNHGDHDEPGMQVVVKTSTIKRASSPANMAHGPGVPNNFHARSSIPPLAPHQPIITLNNGTAGGHFPEGDSYYAPQPCVTPTGPPSSSVSNINQSSVTHIMTTRVPPPAAVSNHQQFWPPQAQPQQQPPMQHQQQQPPQQQPHIQHQQPHITPQQPHIQHAKQHMDPQHMDSNQQPPFEPPHQQQQQQQQPPQRSNSNSSGSTASHSSSEDRGQGRQDPTVARFAQPTASTKARQQAFNEEQRTKQQERNAGKKRSHSTPPNNNVNVMVTPQKKTTPQDTSSVCISSVTSSEGERGRTRTPIKQSVTTVNTQRRSRSLTPPTQHPTTTESGGRNKSNSNLSSSHSSWDEFQKRTDMFVRKKHENRKMLVQQNTQDESTACPFKPNVNSKSDVLFQQKLLKDELNRSDIDINKQHDVIEPYMHGTVDKYQKRGYSIRDLSPRKERPFSMTDSNMSSNRFNSGAEEAGPRSLTSSVPPTHTFPLSSRTTTPTAPVNLIRGRPMQRSRSSSHVTTVPPPAPDSVQTQQAVTQTVKRVRRLNAPASTTTASTGDSSVVWIVDDAHDERKHKSTLLISPQQQQQHQQAQGPQQPPLHPTVANKPQYNNQNSALPPAPPNVGISSNVQRQPSPAASSSLMGGSIPIGSGSSSNASHPRFITGHPTSSSSASGSPKPKLGLDATKPWNFDFRWDPSILPHTPNNKKLNGPPPLAHSTPKTGASPLVSPTLSGNDPPQLPVQGIAPSTVSEWLSVANTPKDFLSKTSQPLSQLTNATYGGTGLPAPRGRSPLGGGRVSPPRLGGMGSRGGSPYREHPHTSSPHRNSSPRKHTRPPPRPPPSSGTALTILSERPQGMPPLRPQSPSTRTTTQAHEFYKRVSAQ